MSLVKHSFSLQSTLLSDLGLRRNKVLKQIGAEFEERLLRASIHRFLMFESLEKGHHLLLPRYFITKFITNTTQWPAHLQVRLCFASKTIKSEKTIFDHFGQCLQ
jgi:hypothetical protein